MRVCVMVLALCSAGCLPGKPRFALAGVGAGYAASVRTDDLHAHGPFVNITIPTQSPGFNEWLVAVTRYAPFDSPVEYLWRVDIGARNVGTRPSGTLRVWDATAGFHFGQGDLFGFGMTQAVGVGLGGEEFCLYIQGGAAFWFGDRDDEFDSGLEFFARAGLRADFQGESDAGY